MWRFQATCSILYSKKTCDEEILDQIEDLLEASPTTLATSDIVMKYNTTDESVCIKTSTIHKFYNSVCDQKWNLQSCNYRECSIKKSTPQ